jgi:GNAT superfamily N-acetyltransferase
MPVAMCVGAGVPSTVRSIDGDEMDEIRYRRLVGQDLNDHLDQLAGLRIEVFRDFPYLYDGSVDYERRYLRTYGDNPEAVIVGAFHGGTLVGAATGLPLDVEPESLQAPIRAVGLDPVTVFYFGESVLRKAYRGRGAGVRFFKEREAHAARLGRFAAMVFCGVIRPEDHPRRPGGYRPLDLFWQRRGFSKLEGAIGTMSWQDLDETVESAKPMQFWVKRL